MRKILSKLRNKYKEALEEIKDIEKEFETQREDYLDMIRISERDSSFYKEICLMLFK